VQERTLKNYFAFTRLKNFACVEIRPTARKLLVYLKVDPATTELQPRLHTRCQRDRSLGTGDLEVTLSKAEDPEHARRLFEQSYEAS
jgi:predicted transport protein